MKEEKKIDRNSSSSKMNNFLIFLKIIFIIFDVIRCNKETIIPGRRRRRICIEKCKISRSRSVRSFWNEIYEDGRNVRRLKIFQSCQQPFHRSSRGLIWSKNWKLRPRKIDPLSLRYRPNETTCTYHGNCVFIFWLHHTNRRNFLHASSPLANKNFDKNIPR